MKRIAVYQVLDKGTVVVIPAGVNARVWADLIHQERFTPQQITSLKRLGVDVTVVATKEEAYLCDGITGF